MKKRIKSAYYEKSARKALIRNWTQIALDDQSTFYDIFSGRLFSIFRWPVIISFILYIYLPWHFPILVHENQDKRGSNLPERFHQPSASRIFAAIPWPSYSLAFAKLLIRYWTLLTENNRLLKIIQYCSCSWNYVLST